MPDLINYWICVQDTDMHDEVWINLRAVHYIRFPKYIHAPECACLLQIGDSNFRTTPEQALILHEWVQEFDIESVP